jgi:hypothetical protein
MGGSRLALAFVATVLLVSCGGGQSGSGGNGGGGTGGAATGGAGPGGAGGAATGGAGGAGTGGAGGQAAGTGGGGGGPNCNSVTQACGGNIVGTWRVAQTCLSATKDLSSVCVGASATLDYTFAGTVTYNADKTYSSAVTGSALVHEHYPAGCMPFGYTCAQLEQIALDAGTSTCSADAGGGCNCDGVSTLTPTVTTGTYSTFAGTLTTMHDGTTTLASYCVEGSSLYESVEPAADAGVTAVGIVAFAKQ